MALYSTAKQFLRHRLLALRDAGTYPVLLPHHRVVEMGVQTLERAPMHLPREVRAALRLCDGTRTLEDICRESTASSTSLHELHDADVLLLWPTPVVDPPAVEHPQAIIVSPHPDDAALCLGGMMLAAGPGAMLVMDVFMRTAWSRFPTELNDVGHIAVIRNAEEQLMARLAGATILSLDLPEALLRQHMFDAVFSDAPTSWDQEVRSAIQTHAQHVAGKHPRAIWYLPLALGNHLDHRIVRDAALATIRSAGVGSDRIRFYEDLPYAHKLGGVQDFAGAMPGVTLRSEIIDIEPFSRWKLELNRTYWSQFTWSQLCDLRDYARRIGGGKAVERIWRE